MIVRLVLVTGLAGSGKTQALRCLEDMGFFAVDNLPVPLIVSFAELLERGEDGEALGAFVVDARERANLETLPGLLEQLRARPGVSLTILFLDAQEETLLRRFSETRRPHPLDPRGGQPVELAIRLEMEVLAPLREMADLVVHTDGMSPHQLRRTIQESLTSGAGLPRLRCQVVSFGYRFGLPRDANLVLDVRFITNPYFKPEFKEMDGRNPGVVEFLENQEDYREFNRRLEDLVAFLMPRFVAEGKTYATLAVGCTGGKHRSVAIAERLGAFLRQQGFKVDVRHRDVERGMEPGRP